MIQKLDKIVEGAARNRYYFPTACRPRRRSASFIRSQRAPAVPVARRDFLDVLDAPLLNQEIRQKIGDLLQPLGFAARRKQHLAEGQIGDRPRQPKTQLRIGRIAQIERTVRFRAPAARCSPQSRAGEDRATGGDGSSSSKNSTAPRRKARSSFKRTISNRRRPASGCPCGRPDTGAAPYRRSRVQPVLTIPFSLASTTPNSLPVAHHLGRSFLCSGPQRCAGAVRRRAATPPEAETAAIDPAACYYYHFRAAKRAARLMILKLKRTPGIYLVGFMGSGKSTVGRALADELGWAFTDLDEEIEAREKIHHRGNFRYAWRSGFPGSRNRGSEGPCANGAVRPAAGDRAWRRCVFNRRKFRAGVE